MNKLTEFTLNFLVLPIVVIYVLGAAFFGYLFFSSGIIIHGPFIIKILLLVVFAVFLLIAVKLSSGMDYYDY